MSILCPIEMNPTTLSSYSPTPSSLSTPKPTLHSLRPIFPVVQSSDTCIMGSKLGRKGCIQPQLTPLMEGPNEKNKTSMRYWGAFRSWIRIPIEKNNASGRIDLKLLLGVLACPLAPIPLPRSAESCFRFPAKDINPLQESGSARYIIHQYLAATRCLKQEKCVQNMYVAGSVRMVCYNNERMIVKKEGCFVLWAKSPGMWLLELVISGYKIVAGSDGKTVWRHMPWLGMNAAKGSQRPLRRVIQGLDPRCTANMFAKAQCLGEKCIGDDNCFVLKVTADRETISERSHGQAEVIRHVLYGYFSQKSGLLVYVEDSHLARVQTQGSAGAIYWETIIGSSIEDYRDVDGILIAQQGRTVATLYRFGESSVDQSRTRMEEEWTIDDVALNVPGVALDCFIPPVELLNVTNF